MNIRGSQTPAGRNTPGLPRGAGTAANPPRSLGDAFQLFARQQAAQIQQAIAANRRTLQALEAARDEAVAAGRTGQVIDYNRLINRLAAEIAALGNDLDRWLRLAGF